jgi:hypothetical protein
MSEDVKPIFDRPLLTAQHIFSKMIETIQFISNCTLQELARQVSP